MLIALFIPSTLSRKIVYPTLIGFHLDCLKSINIIFMYQFINKLLQDSPNVIKVYNPFFQIK